MLNVVATTIGPKRKPCCLNGKIILRGGTKDIDAKRTALVDGIFDISPIIAITNNAPLAGALSAHAMYSAVSSCGFSGIGTCHMWECFLAND